MFRDTQHGQFWPSDKPEHPVPGTLSIEDRDELRLTTTAVQDSSFGAVRDFFESDDTPRTICGATPQGYVALVETRSSGKKAQFNRYLPETQRTWFCSYALRSQSYEPTPLKEEITSVEVQIQFLPAWAANGHNLKLDWRSRTLSWPTQWDTQTSNWSLGEVGLRYFPRISGPDPERHHHKAGISIDASFIVKFNHPQAPDAVLNTVNSLQSLVSIAKGEPASVERYPPDSRYRRGRTQSTLPLQPYPLARQARTQGQRTVHIQPYRRHRWSRQLARLSPRPTPRHQWPPDRQVPSAGFCYRHDSPPAPCLRGLPKEIGKQDREPNQTG